MLSKSNAINFPKIVCNKRNFNSVWKSWIVWIENNTKQMVTWIVQKLSLSWFMVDIFDLWLQCLQNMRFPYQKLKVKKNESKKKKTHNFHTYWKRLRIMCKAETHFFLSQKWKKKISPTNWSNLVELAHKIYIAIDSIATISWIFFCFILCEMCAWHKSVFWIQFH